MKKGYIGIDIGSISTKGVVIDEKHNIVANEYIWTEGDPINAVKRLLKSLEKQVKRRAARANWLVRSPTPVS